jgi:adenylate cyclase
LSLAPLRQNVMGRTGGNPFFIEEVVRALVEDGTLSGEPGAYRLTRSLAEVRVPPTVQAVLAARIDRLPERDKQVLQTAAVIGRTFPEAVLQAVAGQTGEHLATTLRALSTAEFLQEETAAPSPEYRFWHPLTQEVAYGTLLAERRARIHTGVARALADLDPARQDERAALIASHFEAAGNHLEAARWNARAASRALRGSMDESIRRWKATIAHLDDVTETDETLALGVRARTYLLRPGSRRGIDAAEAEALFAEGRVRAERLADPGPLGLLITIWGSVQFWQGDLRAGRASYLEGRHLVAGSADLDAQAGPSYAVAYVCLYLGTIAEGLPLIEEAIALSGGDIGWGMQSLGYSALLRALLTRDELLLLGGKLEESREEFDRTLALAREHQQFEVVAWGLPLAARIAFLAGDGPSGLDQAGEARRMAEESGNPFLAALALQAMGIAQQAEGRPGEAVVTLTRARDEVRFRRTGLDEEASILTHLARAHLGAGDTTTARRCADDAVDVARRQGARVLECLALVTRAHVLRVAGAPDPVVHDDLVAALALVQETGAVTYEPLIGEESARLEGDKERLREAASGFAAIGAAGHARRLEAELAGGPPASDR